MKATGLERVARNFAELERALDFYMNALGFVPVGEVREDAELAELLRVKALRVARLRLGGREIELSQCFPPGAPYACADAYLVQFQHIALLTPDIDAAYTKALDHGAVAISEAGPVRLPAASGGVTAVKFRDPEGHPLEFLQHSAAGYDHSAISVLNVERSVAFYQGIGLSLASRQRNHGVEQDALDGLEGAEVAVVALRPPRPSPHVELLGYQCPRAIACQWAPADGCADRLVFAADTTGLRMLRDPDGHVVLLDGR